VRLDKRGVDDASPAALFLPLFSLSIGAALARRDRH